jgi:DegV family protein with EDD domain
MKRLIVTDSTSDLSGNMLRGLDVKIIPVNILLDGQNYKDRVQIKIREFYDNFDRFKTMKTAPVSVEEFSYVYRKLTAGYDEIIFILCSRHLSKTYDHAVKVHQQFGSAHNCRTAVIDSRHCGMGLGLIVLEAARAMKDGRSFEDILGRIEALSGKIITYMTVPTLKYLRANQKISGLKSLVANMMNIRPVLGFDDGRIVVKTKLSGKIDNLLLEMVDYIKKDVGDSPVVMALAHARDTRYVRDLETVFNSRFDCRQMYIACFGPSVGISTGPETMGVSFFKV